MSSKLGQSYRTNEMMYLPVHKDPNSKRYSKQTYVKNILGVFRLKRLQSLKRVQQFSL